ncbi:MAG: hypothetical protein EA367_05340, partial [Leptolyngbya sp. DLM2.Bin15]
MTKLVKFDLGDDESIVVEVDEVKSSGRAPASKSPGEIADNACQTFSKAMAGITPMVRSLKA